MWSGVTRRVGRCTRAGSVADRGDRGTGPGGEIVVEVDAWGRQPQRCSPDDEAIPPNAYLVEMVKHGFARATVRAQTEPKPGVAREAGPAQRAVGPEIAPVAASQPNVAPGEAVARPENSAACHAP